MEKDTWKKKHGKIRVLTAITTRIITPAALKKDVYLSTYKK